MIFTQSFYHVPYQKVHVQIYSSLLYVRKKLRITGEWRSAPTHSLQRHSKKGLPQSIPLPVYCAHRQKRFATALL